MSIDGLRFGHVAFKVADVEKSIRWYGDAFGAKVIYRVAPSGDRPELMFLEFAKGQCVELFPGGKNMSGVAAGSDRLHSFLSRARQSWSRRWSIWRRWA